MCETVSTFILVNEATRLLAGTLFAFFYSRQPKVNRVLGDPRPKTLLTFGRHEYICTYLPGVRSDMLTLGKFGIGWLIKSIDL